MSIYKKHHAEKPFVPVVTQTEIKPKPKAKIVAYQIPAAITEALGIINKKLDDLIAKDAEVHKKIEKPAFVSAEYNFEEACKEAKRISKDLNCVQHVNRVSDGVYKLDDFFDAKHTEASYENGLKK